MGLLNPGALIYLAIIPALLIAYLVRERPIRATVSSVLAFRALRALKPERPVGRPLIDWMFLLEILILCLAVLAMAQPFLANQRRPVAVVLDNSASMQARMPSGQSRFDAARSRLAAMLSGEARDSEVSLYLTAPAVHQPSSAVMGTDQARSEIQRAEATDAPEDSASVAHLVDELLSGNRFSEVILATSHPVTAPSSERLRTIVTGDRIPNFAIGSFLLRREKIGADTFRARLSVANFTPEKQTLRVEITGDGKHLADAQTALDPREVGGVEFPELPAARIYTARLKPDDEFPLDNVAWAAPEAIRATQILFVTTTPAEGAGLDALPGVQVRVISPEQFSPADASKADVLVMQNALPKELPPANTLLVMPPGGDPVFQLDVTPASRVAIVGWQNRDPITDGVNFRLLDLRRAESFGTHAWMHEVVSGENGGLLLAGERQGHRNIVVGFDPFPYLGKKNLPMSVITLNMLSELAGFGADSAGFRTGEPWLVPAGAEKIITPAGAELSVEAGKSFAGADRVGVYEMVTASGDKRPRAVNLNNLAESDFGNPAPFSIQAAAPAGGVPSFLAQTRLEFYLIAAMLALAALEAMLAYRRKRAPIPEIAG